MIDQSTFKAEWKILEDRFDRRHSAPTIARYYQSLSPRMSTREFRASCRTLFDRPGHYRFPGPSEFMTACSSDSETAALDQWELCDRIMRGEPEVIERMSEAGRKTVALMGGYRTLRNTPEDDVHFRRQEFMRLYEHSHEIHDRETVTLPPWTDEGRRIMRQLLGGEEADGGTSPPDDTESQQLPALTHGDLS